MKTTQLFALALTLTAGFGISTKADLAFNDTTFSDTNWVPGFPMTSGLGGTAGGGPVNASGNDYVQLSVTNNGNRSGMAAYCHNGTFTYNPATQGAITNLDYAWQLIAISSASIPPVAFARPALRQGGTLYAVSPSYSTANLTWTPLSATNLAASDFGNLFTSNGQINVNLANHPNFSSAGAPLEFGWVAISNTGQSASANSATFGLDAVSLVVHTVRQPPSLGIQTIAGVVISGITNHAYLVEYTPTVGPQNWQTLTNIVLTASPFTVYDYQSGSASQRFYRATDVTP
jgi:hypothetical protein